MRRALRWAGLLGAVVCVIVWVALGSNRGWTKTTRTRMEKDPVTEIEYPAAIEKDFSPGLELLAAGLLASTVLFGVSFFIRGKNKLS